MSWTPTIAVDFPHSSGMCKVINQRDFNADDYTVSNGETLSEWCIQGDSLGISVYWTGTMFSPLLENAQRFATEAEAIALSTDLALEASAVTAIVVIEVSI